VIHLQPFTGLTALQLTLLVVGISVMVTSLEGLYNYKIYAPGGWLNWEYLRPCRKLYSQSRLIGGFSDILFHYPAVLLLLGVRFLLAAGLIAAVAYGKIPAAAVLLLMVSGLLVHLRNHYSNNGSDQLSNIILVAASIALLPSRDSLILDLSLFFIACQSSLSYLTSGFLKLLAPDWRNGKSLRDILHTASFGHPWVTRLLGRRRPIYSVLSFSVIFLEIFMGLGMLFPPPVCVCLLGGGVLLHASIAFTMGLNNFLWTFPSTYPCIYFICCKLH
jgi:hypothetical protein